MLINERRAAAVMDDAGLDGVVGTRMENVYYLTGVQNVSQAMFPYDQQCYAVVSRDKLTAPMLVISTGDWDQSTTGFAGLRGTVHYGMFYRELPQGGELTELERHTIAQTIDRTPQKSALEALVVALEESGLVEGRIALDEKAFNPAFRPELERRLPRLKIVAGADLLRKIRTVKTEEEVNRLRRAAEVTEGAIQAAIAIAREGVTEQEMAREFERYVVSQGGRATFALLRFGRNATFGQIPSDDTPLRPGDHIWFDVGCQVNGYWADLARIFVLGEPSDKLRRYYDAALVGENRALEFTRPGVTAGEIFDVTVQAVREAGIPHYRRHHVGHGIGVEVYDPPLLAAGQDAEVEVGTVLNIETPYYELAWGAVHVEDPFVVRENGNEVLTTLSRELGVIPL